ncbi:hypothetical protein [Bacillus toyonensis]|uniref:hypothetical protein n=1 Tax=Bacillus toyonensis TaxID=155322 RepID=UPI002E1A0C48|nr:hypothetical protein [Bacillus toyonensis]
MIDKDGINFLNEKIREINMLRRKQIYCSLKCIWILWKFRIRALMMGRYIVNKEWQEESTKWKKTLRPLVKEEYDHLKSKLKLKFLLFYLKVRYCFSK